MMAVSLAQLKTELQTDPLTYGYAAYIAANEPENCASALNKIRLGNDGEAAITIRRADISASEVLEVIDSRDFEAAPSTAHVAWFESATQLTRIRLVNTDGTDTRALGNLKRILQNADVQGSEARLTALANRNGSRAEQLFGPDTVVSISDVVTALALP
jgi:hypothetical protein